MPQSDIAKLFVILAVILISAISQRVSSDTFSDIKRGKIVACSADEECQSKGYNRCDLGECKCALKSVYDLDSLSCKKLAGEECSKDEQCVTGATCVARSVWNRCTCSGSDEYGGRYVSEIDDQCKVIAAGKPCNDNGTRLCNYERGLICEDGTCVCEFPGHQYFNSSYCLTMVGGPCGGNLPSSCVPNAECVISQGAEHGTCQCTTGFVEGNRTCGLDFGESCGTKNPEVSTVPCDKGAGLYCREGTCVCRGLQFYDAKERKCRGSVGAACIVGRDEFCTDGARCKTFRGGVDNPMASGSCQCAEEQYVEGENRTCTLPGKVNLKK